MTSTGNDIVALKAINVTRTQQPDFYTKILSVAEKTLYDQQFANKLALEIFVWLLWSVKESAYKYLQRLMPQLVFSPTRIDVGKLELPVQLLTWFDGNVMENRGFDDKMVYKCTVKFGTHQLYARSVITHDFIFSVVNNEPDFINTCWGIRSIDSPEPEYQSKAVRDFLLIKLNNLISGDNLRIEKNQSGCPILFECTKQTNIAISLAHHDRYIAYSFQLK